MKLVKRFQKVGTIMTIMVTVAVQLGSLKEIHFLSMVYSSGSQPSSCCDL